MAITNSQIGKGTKIWNEELVNIYNCSIGDNCNIGSFVEIGKNVIIGNNCKIQAFSFIPEGVIIGDNVFIGPRVTFTNNRKPDLKIKDWKILETIVEDNVAIGAGAIIVCGIILRKNTFVGAGSVVTKTTLENSFVYGIPARHIKDNK